MTAKSDTTAPAPPSGGVELKAEAVQCKARTSYPDPQDCDWPHCGCDPNATRVVEALVEEGWGPPRRPPVSEAQAGWRMVPVEPTEAEIEAGCRAMHAATGTGAADDPLHSPYQKSWDEPDSVRWRQWIETVTDVRAAMIAAAPDEGRG